MIYLDSAASTKVPAEVLTAITNAYIEAYGNSSSRTHRHGTIAAECIHSARQDITSLIGERPESLVFTSGATESNNLAILGLRQYFKQQRKKAHVITGATEHKSVLGPLRRLEDDGLIELTILQPTESGDIAVTDVLTVLKPETCLVSLMHVNNETGAETKVNEIADGLEDSDAIFHVDASQSFGKFNMSRLEHSRIDMVSMSAHKMFGPQGIGGLLLRRRNFKLPPIMPLLDGGGQERGLRPGTLPTALCAGFGCAAQMSKNSMSTWLDDVRRQKRLLLEELKSNYSVHEVAHNGSPYILSVMIEEINSEAALIALKNSVSVSNGSACTSQSFGASHVLKAMGFGEKECDSVIRFSFSPFEENFEDHFIEISRILKKAKY